MDKYQLVLDIVEHPDNYTSQQLAEILSDAETREIYNLLCKTDSAIEASKEADVEAEWNDFSERHSVRNRRTGFWFGSRAASVAAVVASSLVAVAAGVAVTMAVIDRKPEQPADLIAAAPEAAVAAPDTLIAPTDTAATAEVATDPVLFENEPLEKIMARVADIYGIEVRFNNKEAASLRLYYRLDTSLPLHDVVDQLNTFEQITITQRDNILNVD